MEHGDQHALKLPLLFDATLLEEDLQAVHSDEWIPHFNRSYYEGYWSGVPLIGPAGESHPIRQLHPDPTCESFIPTAILGRCPNIRAALGQFQCQLRSTRLLRLAGGSHIREHTDYYLGFDDGEVRIHVPIRTNADVQFVLAGDRIMMQPGEAWYLDVNRPHRVSNLGASDRIHLVIDCTVNTWVRDLFAQARR
jgi:hypothetical protein